MRGVLCNQGVLRMAEACGMADLLAAAGVEARLLHKLHSFGEAGVPPALFSPRLARPSGRASSRILVRPRSIASFLRKLRSWMSHGIV